MTRARNAAGRTYVVGNGGHGSMSTAAAREIGEISARVDNLAGEVHGIRQSIGALHQKLDERRSIPWGGITAGIAFVGLIGAVIIFGISAYVGAVGNAIVGERAARIEGEERIVSQLEDIAAVIVPRAEINDRRDISAQRTERIEADILRLTESTYPREVHLERWSAFTAELNHVREELTRQAEAFNALYPAGNALNSLAERIERLESRWIDRRMQNENPPIP